MQPRHLLEIADYERRRSRVGSDRICALIVPLCALNRWIGQSHRTHHSMYGRWQGDCQVVTPNLGGSSLLDAYYGNDPAWNPR
jgi:hypothetical protein